MTTIVGAGGLVSRASRCRRNGVLRLCGGCVALSVSVNVRLSGHRNGVLRRRNWQSHRSHIHGHSVAQQAPQDQQHDQHKRQTSAHGANDTGAAREVPNTQTPKSLFKAWAVHHQSDEGLVEVLGFVGRTHIRVKKVFA